MTAFLIFLGVCAVLSLIYLFLVFPAIRRHEYRKNLKGALIAHRGLFDNDGGIPENSMDAFAHAVANGYGIETDIRLTKDGEIVIHHDDSLKRLCGEDKKVYDLSLVELREYNLLGTDQKIPTFKEFLRLIDGKVPLIIEFKADTFKCASLCEKANEILKDYKGIYTVQSFDPYVVYWYKKNDPSVCRGQLADAYKDTFLRRFLGTFLYNFLTRPDYIAFNHNRADSFSYRLQRLLGAFTVGWTFKSLEEQDKRKKDFDSYIFEGFKPRN